MDISREDQQSAFRLERALAEVTESFWTIDHPATDRSIHKAIGSLRCRFFLQLDARRHQKTSSRMDSATASCIRYFSDDPSLLYAVLEVKDALSTLLAYRKTERPSPDELEEESRHVLAVCIKLFDYYVHHIQHIGDSKKQGGERVAHVLEAVLAHDIYKDEAVHIRSAIERIRTLAGGVH